MRPPSVRRGLLPTLLALLAAAGIPAAAPARTGDRSIEARPVLLCDRLGPAEGLSQSTVRGIVQDRAGFIWIATEGGLDRYDGQQIHSFKRDVRHVDSLSHNIVRSLCLGAGGELWVGTESGGLNRLDPRQGRFMAFRHQPGDDDSLSYDMVQALWAEPDGTLWAGTSEGGLNRFDPRQGTFARYRHDPARPDSLPDDDVTALCVDQSGTLWVGTMGGLARLDRRTGRFTVFRHEASDPDSLVHDRVQALCENRPGEIWVGTEQGLCRFDPSSGAFETFASPLAAEGRPPFMLARALLRDRLGRMWVGTWHGLLRWEPSDGRFTAFRLMASSPGPASGEEILSLGEDRSGVLWIGTAFGGALRFNPDRERFVHYAAPPEADGSLKENLVTALAAGRDGSVWVGTAGQSPLNRIDPVRKCLEPVPLLPADESSQPRPVYAIRESRLWPGTLWIGTAGSGLLQFDRQRGVVTRFGPDASSPGSLQGEYVWAIHEAADGVLWVGTLGGGVQRWESDRRMFRAYQHDPAEPTSLSNDSILCIYESPTAPGVLWVGTAGGGLNRLDPATGRCRRYRSDPADPGTLSDNSVAALLELPGQPGILWVGTGDGFDRLDTRTGRCVRHGPEAGLADSAVGGILADRHGRLWISTLRGVSRFDPALGRFANYDARDGIRSGEFNRAACCQAPDGTLYFGGIHGVTAFCPEAFAARPTPPAVVLTAIRVQERDLVPPGEAPFRKEVRLSHDQNFVALEFAAQDYRVPGKNQYACRMEGVDRDWVDCGSRGYARYPGLAPGEYVFRVRAVDSDGVASPDTVALRLVIEPPFWRTAWFLALAAVGFAAVSYLVISLIRKLVQLIAFWRRKQHIGRYRIVDEIGRGGSGTVFKALAPGGGRTVALKILDMGLIDEAGRRRFIQEGLICERLRHPNVVQVFERGEHLGRLFYAMEFVDGISLRRWITGRAGDVRSAAALFSALLDILEEIHQAGIIHRDIKPDNIMLAGDGVSPSESGIPEMAESFRKRIKVLDFGLARIQDAATLTRTSLLAGTLQYMPPEHLFGKKVRDPDYDYYALGVIGYELLAGRAPFRTGESFEVLAAILRDPVVPPADVDGAVPRDLSDLVLRLIERKPSARWREYSRIRAELDGIIDRWSRL